MWKTIKNHYVKYHSNLFRYLFITIFKKAYLVSEVVVIHIVIANSLKLIFLLFIVVTACW